MKKFLTVLLLIAAVFVSCKKTKTIEEQLSDYIQSYLYSIRDATDDKQGSLEDVYNNFLSSKMKETVEFEDFRDHATTRYKGKIGRELRAARATIVVDKETGNFIEGTAQTANVGRMAAVMDQDQSLVFNVRVVKEGEEFKVEQDTVMAQVEKEKGEQRRLERLLKDYQGLIKIDEIVGRKVPDREGWSELYGTILNASEDLDLIRVGVRVWFRDSSGDVIHIAQFMPVVDIRFEGLRTSLLPDSVKVFRTHVNDVPEEWDPNQPLTYSFYMIDGQPITKEDLAKENQERDALKKLIEDTKKADEEARKQLKEMWEREKALKDKIKELQEQAK
jgi:hypothetical protein